jgi:hypothetical protein
MRRIIAGSADDLGLSFKFMPSGAGHDAQDMAPIVETTARIFSFSRVIVGCGK